MGIAVRLYSGENLNGSVSLAVKTGENFAHLKSVGLNDQVESMEVEQGYYVVLYQDADFGGKRQVFNSGRYGRLNDNCDFGVSSIKTYTRCAAIVYTQTNYQGNSAIIDGDVDNFTNTGFFNNEISSIKIMPGYSLTFYKDANFQDDHVTFSADVSDVGDALDDIFSSVSVTYNFAVEVYPDVDFKGTSRQINNLGNISSSTLSDFANGFKSIKVNPGYCAYVFSTDDCTGDKIAYRGPCDITNTGNAPLSISVYSNYALNVYYKGGNSLITTSIPRLSRYDLKEKITSLMISPNYIVQLFKDSDYENDSLILMAGDDILEVDLADYVGWSNAVCSIRVFDTTIPAVYLFSESKYKGQCVKRTDIDSGDSNYTSWYYNSICGRTQHIADNRLSSALVTGDLKVILYEGNPGSQDKSFTLYGPGFFDLGAKARHAVKDEYLYDNIVSSINISSYTPHQSVPAARGYSSAMKLLKGDLHNHTLWSDAYWGGETDSIGIPLNRYIYNPNDTFKIYKALGYDFDGISDHVFGTDGSGNLRYTSGTPRCIPNAGGKCSLSSNDWYDTKNIAKKYEYNFNFAPLAGYEYCLGGIALFEIPHTDDPADTDAHYNVFSTENIYYGQPGGWKNTPANRTDFYKWSALEYANNPDLIVQFNHPSNNGIGFNNFLSSEAQHYDKIPFRLLEVFSKSADGKLHKNRVDAYMSALSNGWRVGATATTDNHDCFCNLEKDYADIRTVVIAEKPSKECVLDALRERRVYATRLPDLRIAFSLTNNRNETAVMGGEIGKSNIYYLDLLFEGETDGILGVELHTENKKVLSLSMENGSWNKYNYVLNNNDIIGAKCVFVVVKTTEYPDEGFENDDYAAITSPIWFAPSVRFFSGTNGSGNATAYIREGKYTLSQLEEYNFTNEWAKSIELDEGLSVMMYEGDNFTGACWAVNSYDSRKNDFSNLVDSKNSLSASSNVTSVWVYNPNSVDAYCNITNKNSGKLVSVSNSSLLDNTLITQHSSTGGNNQKFKLVPCGSTDPEYYYIVAKHSGSVLSVESSSTSDSAHIVQYHSADANNQKFKLISCGDGYFNIAIKSSSTSTVTMVLDVKDASTSENANINQYHSKGANNQKFKIDKA